MNKNKFLAILCVLSGFCFQSCLDYDTPSDEFSQTEVTTDDVIYHGNADNIDYTKVITPDSAKKAIAELDVMLRTAKGGQYALRGGKNGAMPVSHAYQRQYTLGPDNYAQYAVVPHFDFMYGTLNHVYDVFKDFNSGPNGSFLIAKNAFVPLLNHPKVDSIPEIKALYLLFYNIGAQEVADQYGPFPYVDFKNNKVDAPFTYNDLRTIYVNIEANLDSIVNCFQYFKTKPAEYQQVIKGRIGNDFMYWSEAGAAEPDTWIRLANSYKLRLAIHVSKVDPELAKKWGEEAVAGGVIESTDQEVALVGMMAGFTHPLVEISDSWNDTRISASLECLLSSLNHPYIKYLFNKNSANIVNKVTGEVTAANTRIIGMREGVEPGQGQSVGTNPYAAYSRISLPVFAGSFPPLYLMKMSEVDFLRAEGAVRGWNMKGTAEEFYNRGIKYAYLECRMFGSPQYEADLDAYMAQTEATPYTYVDPQGIAPDEPSRTTIGVKWNEGDSKETKLEKIITQKYIASYPFSVEAWTDMRRTGYPKLLPVINPQNGDGSLSAGQIIRRMPFPADDDATLQDIQTTGLPALGGSDQQATRLWWDVEGPNF